MCLIPGIFIQGNAIIYNAKQPLKKIGQHDNMDTKGLKEIHHQLQQTKLGFYISNELKMRGILKKFAFLVDKKRIAEDSRRISEEFYIKNSHRESHLLSLLQDEKSRKIWLEMKRCRITGDYPDRKLCSLDDMYYPSDIFLLGDREKIIDCGAYIGDSTYMFLKKTSNKACIVAYEPDEENYKVLKKHFGKKKNVKLINKGISDRTGYEEFKSLSGGKTRRIQSSIMEENNKNARRFEVVNIDTSKECDGATFIKLEVMGSEWDALQGAKATIKERKPKLAVCIYHSNEDMFRIAEFIHELVPEYKLYVRQHNLNRYDTVLYAVI